MAEITAIQMFKSATAPGGDADAQIDIPNDGEIVAIQASMGMQNGDAAGDKMEISVAFSATNQNTTNDARGTIYNAMAQVNGAVSIGQSQVNEYIDFGTNGIQVMAGERLYLHTFLDTGVNGKIRVIVFFRFKRPARSATRRR